MVQERLWPYWNGAHGAGNAKPQIKPQTPNPTRTPLNSKNAQYPLAMMRELLDVVSSGLRKLTPNATPTPNPKYQPLLPQIARAHSKCQLRWGSYVMMFGVQGPGFTVPQP
jgi:hypothetical protein